LESGLFPLDQLPFLVILNLKQFLETQDMATQTRTTDPKARISLPKGFANATVIIEQISDSEVRIRKARVIPEDECRFLEETTTRLSDRDRDLFLKMLDHPPGPNKAFRRAAAKFKRRHG
jgi:hypothetical protein